MADLQVVITGKDGLSRVFQEVSNSARAAGDAVEAAGQDAATGFNRIDQEAGKAEKAIDDVGQEAKATGNEVQQAARTGAQGMEQLGREAKETERTMDSVAQTTRRSALDIDAFGAAVVAVGGYLTIAGNSAIDQIQIMDGLRQQFGETADEYIALADTIANQSIFNDDDIMRGMQYFSVLREEYALTDQQLQDLMRTTADLATVRGTTFEDASSRVTGAIRGEAEAAEFLGLSLQQSAIDRENLTLTMTNQERAQFQLNALNQQAAYAQGAASAALETDVGRRAALTNAIQDNTQAVGQFLGPYNAMLAGMATGAVGLAQFAGGFAPLVAGIRTATTASLAFIATPIGATVTALGAALAVATGWWMDNRREAEATAAAWAAADQAAADLTTQINQMTLAGDFTNARWARSFAEQLLGDPNDPSVVGYIDWYRTELENMLGLGFHDTSWLDDFVRETMIGQGLDPNNLQLFQAMREQIVQEMMPTPQDEQELAAALGQLTGLFGQANIDTAQLQADMAAIFAQRDEAAGRGLDWMIEQFVALYQETILLTEATGGLGTGLTNLSGQALTATEALFVGSGAVTQFTGDSLEAATAADVLAVALTGVGTASVVVSTGTEQMTSEMDTMALALLAAAEAAGLTATEIGAVAAAYRDLGNASAVGGIDAGAVALDQAREKAEALLALLNSLAGTDNPLAQWNAAGLGTSASLAAEGLNDAAAAAENLFRVIVGNTNAIAQQASATLSWAEELINVEGEYGKIDDLLNDGIITLTEYTAAQQAYNDIAQDTASIQSYVLEIQAMQAPLIAESTSALENQMEAIARMPAEQQLVALAWMDSATAAKAFEIQALAASAAMGDLGPKGEESVQKMIEGLIAADPALEALLVDMGLIEVAFDALTGEKVITFHLEGASESNQILQELTQSIQMLVDWLDDGSINGSINIEDNATPVINDVLSGLDSVAIDLGNLDGQNADVTVTGDPTDAINDIGQVDLALGNLDGDSATVSIFANDMASGVIQGALNALNVLDGMVATATVNTRYTTTGNPSGVGPTRAHGGIAGYAMGGDVVPIWAGEAGPEIAHFAGGGSAWLPREGMYTVPVGTFIEPANSARSQAGGRPIQIIIQGDVLTREQLISDAARAIWAAEVEEELQDQLRNGVAA